MSAEAEMNAELGITELAHWILVQLMMTNPKIGHILAKNHFTQIWTRFLGHFPLKRTVRPLVSIKTRFKIDSYQKLKTINDFWNCLGGFSLVAFNNHNL